MSDWRGFDGYPRAPKKPPPAHGIRMKKAGSTWWGQRWIEALARVLRGDAGRLARGRTYARAGRTHDFVVERGKVSAKVTGSRATPYQITIALKQLDAGAWRKVIAAMAAKAQFAAELLAGQMPTNIEEVFLDAGVSLFPRARTDLVTTCSCPDWGDPCKHVAAAHYVLGEALDRDPFLLFELCGQTKEQVLDALRSARVVAAEPARSGSKRSRAGAAPASAAGEVPPMRRGATRAADYDEPREALPALHFRFDAPLVPAAVVRQLGAPPAWDGATSPADLLAPLVRAAADAARRIAMAEQTAAADEGAASEQSKPAPALEGSAARKARPKRPTAPASEAEPSDEAKARSPRR